MILTPCVNNPPITLPVNIKGFGPDGSMPLKMQCGSGIGAQRAAAQKLLRTCAARRRSAAAQTFSERPALRSAAAQTFFREPARLSAAAQTFSREPARRSRAAAQRSRNLRGDSFRIQVLSSTFALFKYVFPCYYVIFRENY